MISLSPGKACLYTKLRNSFPIQRQLINGAVMSQPIRVGLVLRSDQEYCRSILRGIREYAEARPRWVLLPCASEPEAVEALRALRPRGLIAHAVSEPLAAALTRLGRPLVNVSGALPEGEGAMPRVGPDDDLVGQAAARHLLDQGLPHFGFVGRPDNAASARREAAFRRTLAQAGHAVSAYCDRGVIRQGPLGPPWALDAKVRRWLRSLPKPVGVFAPTDLWGVQLAEVCRQAGLRVPEEVALVGADNDALLCELSRPPLSSIALPARRIGYEAAALLARLLEGRAAPPGPLLLPPLGVVARQSSDLLALPDRDVAAAAAFIRSRGHLPIRVGDVLREVPVSRRSLERRFRKSLGRGLWEEIRRVHLERARDLLAGTGLPMGTVAQRAGFSDAKQLSVVFRQETGLTPTAFRRRFCDSEPAGE
jgi:LacI family transcriptional regulator